MTTRARSVPTSTDVPRAALGARDLFGVTVGEFFRALLHLWRTARNNITTGRKDV